MGTMSDTHIHSKDQASDPGLEQSLREATMPIKFPTEAQNFKYLIFVDATEGRRTISTIVGICSMKECFTFISKYPSGAVTPDKKQTIPQSKEYFEHEVSVKVMGISTVKASQKMPDWLEYMSDQFGGTLRFCDAYTFHVARHYMLANMGMDQDDL
jgi:hypothetical protein